MATTTGTFNWFDAGVEHMFGAGTNSVDLVTPDIRVALFLSTVTITPATDEFIGDLTNEVTAGGYARYALTDEAKSEPTAGTFMLDSSNPTWAVTGTPLVARYWVLYEHNASDAAAVMLAYGLLDSGDADVTTIVGNTLTLNVNASGWFRGVGA